jgi:hypothetical protein
MLKIKVEVYNNEKEMRLLKEYELNHDDPNQRRVLGEQCRNAFEGGQMIVTFPVDK